MPSEGEDNRASALPHQSAVLPSVGSTSNPYLAPERSGITTTGEQPSFDESCIDLADLKFDQANEIMRKLDETAEKKHPYSERLFNERLGLDQFYRDGKSRKDVGAKAVEDISAKQVQLVETLSGEPNPIE